MQRAGHRSEWMGKVASVMLGCAWLAACGGENAVPAANAAAGTAAPAAASAVQEHDRGVFFDWRPVREEALRLARESRPSADRLQSVQIVDSAGFGQPVVAMRLEIPQGWRSEGRVDWDKNALCVWNGPRMQFEAASPDALHGIAIYPAMGWQVSTLPLDQFDPCPTAPMATPREYLEFIARNTRPNARVLAYRDRPELSEPNGQFPAYAGELLIGYSLQGHEMRESLVTRLNHVRLAPGGIAANAQIVLAVRAPDGLLDFGFAERIRKSLRPADEWYRQYGEWSKRQFQESRRLASEAIDAWHRRRMNEITLAGMTARHNIRMNTIAEVGRINTQIFNSRMATGDRIQAATIDAIQEVQPWRDPSSGQQVDLSIHYRHAWQLDDGRQFLTNDANLDPGRDLGIGGHRLEPMR